MLNGLKKRHLISQSAFPESATADNCCTVRGSICQVFPEIAVLLDVWHFKSRYAAALTGPNRQLYTKSLVNEVTMSILAEIADKTKPAVYRSKEDQEARLEAVFQKYKGYGVFSSAASQVW